MNAKKLTAVALFGLVTFSAQLANALEGYQTTFVNPALGTTFGAGAGCISCHAGGITTQAALTTPFFRSYNSGLTGIALGAADSDADGFTNKQEAIGNVNDFNISTITPFTKATGGTGGIALANVVYVTGDSRATEKAITAATSGITVPAGSTILGGVAIDIYASPVPAAPITLLYKAGAAALTSTIYAVDTYSIAIADPYATNTTLPLAATDWTLTAQGAVQINQLPAGADATYDLVVVRVTPVTTPFLGGDSASSDDDNENKTTGCIADISPTPLMMFFALFMLGFMVKRKKA